MDALRERDERGIGRVCCVRVFELAVQAARRNRPELRERPVAILGPGARDGIRNLSREASQQGLAAGMNSTQALAVCPRAEVLPWNEKEVDAASREIEVALQTISPQVEVEGDGVFFVGCRGLDLLHGGEDGTLRKLHLTLHDGGFEAFLGAAATRFVAFAASVKGDVAWSVPTGGEAEFLANLPLGILPMGDALADRLRGLGLHTLGDLAALPAASVEMRFGREGLACHRLARGDDASLPRYAVLDATPEVRLEVNAASIGDLEAPLMEALQSLLCAVARRSRSCASLRAVFHLVDGGCRDVEVALSRPSLNPRTFWRQIRLALSESSFSAEACDVRLEVLREQSGSGEQGRLFLRAGEIGDRPVARRLAEALDRLRATYGKDAVVPPRRKTVEEGGASKSSPGGGNAATTGRTARGVVLFPALRILDPPVRVQASGDGARLDAFAWAGGRHRVLTLVGPQRSSGEWWKSPFERDYYEVLTSDQGLFWLFFDHADRGWYLQGLFD